MTEPSPYEQMRANCVPQCPDPTAHHDGAGARYKHERDLLADALGRVLVASGVATDQPLTGPQLLLLADDYIEHLTGARQ